MAERTSSGNSGSPITFDHSRPARQTTADGTRSHQKPPAPEEGEEWENPYAYTIEKPHTSAIRYNRSAVPPRRSAPADYTNPKRTRLIKERRPLLARVLIVTGLGLLVLVLGIMVWSALAGWWQVHSDDVTYGRPRTYQTDQYVGHGIVLRIPTTSSSSTWAAWWKWSRSTPTISSWTTPTTSPLPTRSTLSR